MKSIEIPFPIGQKNQLSLPKIHKALTPCVCACQTNLSCATTLPQKISHWFFSQNLSLSSGTAFRHDCQITNRGSNLDSNLKTAAWLMRSAQKSLSNLCGKWILFWSNEDPKIKASKVTSPTLIPKDQYPQLIQISEIEIKTFEGLKDLKI